MLILPHRQLVVIFLQEHPVQVPDTTISVTHLFQVVTESKLATNISGWNIHALICHRIYSLLEAGTSINLQVWGHPWVLSAARWVHMDASGADGDVVGAGDSTGIGTTQGVVLESTIS